MDPTWVSYASIGFPILVSIIGVFGSYKVYATKIDTLCEDMKSIKNKMRDMRDKVIACETILKERGPVTQRKSPVALTERGKTLLKNSEGEKFIDDNFQELKELVEKQNPKTAYDVQELSQKVIEGFKDDNRFSPLKNYLFKEGENIADLISVMGIHLRDKILLTKGWAVADVDKHDPKLSKNILGSSEV